MAIFWYLTGCGLKKLKNKASELFFSEILVMSIEGFIELYIAGYLNYNKPLDTTFGEIHAHYLGYVLLFLGFFFMPSALIWVYIQDRETLEQEDFEKMWGPCYADISLRNNWTRAYYIIYIARRFVFITIGLFI